MERINGNSEQNDERKAREINLNNGVSNGVQNGNGHAPEKIEKALSPKVLAKVKKTRSFLELSLNTNSVLCPGRNEKKVLVIYTGGTIGMIKNKDGGKIINFD